MKNYLSYIPIFFQNIPKNLYNRDFLLIRMFLDTKVKLFDVIDY